MKLGYARVRSEEQSLDIQIEDLMCSDVGLVIYTTISASAEMERKRILQRCNEGRERARAEGRYLAIS